MKRKVKTYRKKLALLTDRHRRQSKLGPKYWTNFFMNVRPFAIFCEPVDLGLSKW